MATKMTREEAINTVRNIYQTNKEKEALATLIPELAESEDERIRKRLIEYFEGFSMGNAEVKWEGLNVQEVLVWLEKQKEPKQEKFPPYPDPAGTSDLEEAAKEYASKTLCDPDDGPSTGLAKESFIAGAEWQKEQKPAEWSEEDEEILKLLILNIGRYKYFGGMSSERILAFLKSLRPQYHGDVTMTEAYKMGLEAGKASSWKPNEEQMNALLNAEGFLRAGLQHDSAKTIAELYEQLKKL